MVNPSVWADTRTYFPLVLHELEKRRIPPGTACIVGASDGKFVLPLALRGWAVKAIEVDSVAIHGHSLERDEATPIEGLKARLREAECEQLVTIIEGDFLEFSPSDQCGCIFTSCSWHYSRNRHRTVDQFVEKMKNILQPGGLFAAEYMMPVEAKHFQHRHYLREGDLRNLLGNDWNIIDEFYTPPFLESPHLGQSTGHVHRMGFLIAIKPMDL